MSEYLKTPSASETPISSSYPTQQANEPRGRSLSASSVQEAITGTSATRPRSLTETPIRILTAGSSVIRRVNSATQKSPIFASSPNIPSSEDIGTLISSSNSSKETKIKNLNNTLILLMSQPSNRSDDITKIRNTLTILNFTPEDYEILKNLVDGNVINSQTVDLTKRLFAYLDLPGDLITIEKRDLNTLAVSAARLGSEGTAWATVWKILDALYNAITTCTLSSSPEQLQKILKDRTSEFDMLINNLTEQLKLAQTSRSQPEMEPIQRSAIIKQLTNIRRLLPEDSDVTKKIDVLLTAMSFTKTEYDRLEQLLTTKNMAEAIRGGPETTILAEKLHTLMELNEDQRLGDISQELLTNLQNLCNEAGQKARPKLGIANQKENEIRFRDYGSIDTYQAIPKKEETKEEYYANRAIEQLDHISKSINLTQESESNQMPERKIHAANPATPKQWKSSLSPLPAPSPKKIDLYDDLKVSIKKSDKALIPRRDEMADKLKAIKDKINPSDQNYKKIDNILIALNFTDIKHARLTKLLELKGPSTRELADILFLRKKLRDYHELPKLDKITCQLDTQKLYDTLKEDSTS